MDHKGDKYGYLRKTGAIGTCTKAVSVSGSTRGKGSLGSASVETKGLAKRAKIEGNESAMYEKLEKRSLKGLKGGGTEKELRAGHNTRGHGTMDLNHPALNPISNPKGFAMAHQGTPANIATADTMKSAVKPAYNPVTNPVRATRQRNRADVAAARATGGDVAAVRKQNRADLREAKNVRQERNDMGMRASDRAAGAQARTVARAQTDINRMDKRSAIRDAAKGARLSRTALRDAVRGSKKRGLASLV